VFVQRGNYFEAVVLADGVDVLGGYDMEWALGDVSDFNHRAEIHGQSDGGTGQYLAVRAHQITQTTKLANIALSGPNVPNAPGSYGKSSYAIHALNADLILDNLDIDAGNGANGQNGNPGTSASPLSASSAMHGNIGGHANQFASSCETTSHGDGATGGLNGPLQGGGKGGNGGEMDTCCSLGVCSLCNCDATPGDVGLNAQTWQVNGYGYRGVGGSPCGQGQPGNDGRVINGSAGSGGNGFSVLANFWAGNPGQGGGLGADGTGGGGGGGSGGCDTGTDSYGAGGGGGGAGGGRATVAAGGGGAGGGSFGLFAVNSTIQFQNSSVTRGNAGNGGNGGQGGRGQDPGLGGNGGNGAGGSPPGRDGGDGGHGGHGGGGGGGAGGSSYGVYSHNSIVVTGGINYSGGSPGQGGAGGISAPGVPAAYDDGNDGTPGGPGGVGNVFPKHAAVASNGQSLSKANCVAEPCVIVAAPPGSGTQFFFSEAVPNPTESLAQFQLGLSEPTRVRLDMFSVSGRRLLQVVDRRYEAGVHELQVDTSTLASGIYFARLVAGTHELTRKLLVLR
jgi:hypothetical protein